MTKKNHIFRLNSLPTDCLHGFKSFLYLEELVVAMSSCGSGVAKEAERAVCYITDRSEFWLQHSSEDRGARYSHRNCPSVIKSE